MTQRTMLAKQIDIAGKKVKLDKACKRLISNKIILAWIMKHTMEEFREYSVNEIANQYIEGQPVVSKTPVHPDEKNPQSLIYSPPYSHQR